MSSTRYTIKRELIQNSLTVEELLKELEQEYGTKTEIEAALNSMLRSGEVRLDEENFRLYVDDPIEGKLVPGVFNKDDNWEPMISITVSEYEELKEIEAIYKGLQK